MHPGKRKAPAPGMREQFRTTNKDRSTAADHTPIVSENRIDPLEFEQSMNGIYIAVVQVRSEAPEPRVRRYFYANLPAAQRRVDLAAQDGRQAFLYLAQLRIVADGVNRLNVGEAE